MINIQYIGKTKKTYSKFTCSAISNPLAFDSFDVNLIDYSESSVFNCESTNFLSEGLIEKKNLQNLKDIIVNSKKSINIIMLPQNIRISHKIQYSQSLFYDELKNIKEFLSACLYEFMFAPSRLPLGFEPNITLVNGKTIHSDLYFKTNQNVLTLAKDSNKATTLKVYEHLFYTFLDLSNEEDIIDFLKEIQCINAQCDYPQWLKDTNFNDDISLVKENACLKNEIDILKSKINVNNSKLDENLFYKSILIETGEKLIEIVFKIIKEMLDIDLSDFEDKKREDFLFKANDVTFIGEVKGVNEGVKNANISQIDNHKSCYEDELESKGLPDEIIKKILIINDQRKKPINEREPIHQNQIDKAKREDVLIIRAVDLLNIFEMFKQNRITKEKILEILKDQTGSIVLE